MRLAITALLLVSCSLAQNKPDFSVIFLRTQTRVDRGNAQPAVPRVLSVQQTEDEIALTATRNGETAVAHYRLSSKKSDNVYARFKGKNLLVRTTVKWQLSSTWPQGGWPLSEPLEEKWELSPDRQQLTNHHKEKWRRAYRRHRALRSRGRIGGSPGRRQLVRDQRLRQGFADIRHAKGKGSRAQI